MEEQLPATPARSTVQQPVLRDFMSAVESQIPVAAPRERIQSATLRDWVAVIFRHRGLVVSSFICILAGATMAAFSVQKQYESHVKILVKRDRAEMVLTPDSSPQPVNIADISQEDLNSEVELLKSRDLLEKVVVACGLHLQPEQPSLLDYLKKPAGQRKSGIGGPDIRIPLAVLAMEKSLTVEAIPKSHLIDVGYKAPDARLAARVLETLTSLYLEKHLAVHRPPGALDFFQQQTEQYRKELGSAEQSLARYGAERGVLSIELEKDLALRMLSDFEARLHESQVAEAAVEQRIKSLEAQVASTPARVVTQVKTADNPYLLEQLKTTLLNLQLKRTELLTKYEPTYRAVQEVDTQIAQAAEALAQAEKGPVRDETTDVDRTRMWLDEETAKARAERATLRAQTASLMKSVEDYRRKVRGIGERAVAYQDLSRVAKTAEENYILYQRRQEEARISDALDRKRIVNAAIAEAATVPPFPTGPSRSMYLMLGIVVAALTSFGLAFVADYVDPSFRTPDEVENILGVSVLACVPRERREFA